MRSIAIRTLFMILTTLLGLLLIFYTSLYSTMNISYKIEGINLESYMGYILNYLITNCLSSTQIQLIYLNDNLYIQKNIEPYTLDKEKIDNLNFLSCVSIFKFNINFNGKTTEINLIQISPNNLALTILNLESGYKKEFNGGCLNSYSYSKFTFVKIKKLNKYELGMVIICAK